jgi:hypothetical protein
MQVQPVYRNINGRQFYGSCLSNRDCGGGDEGIVHLKIDVGTGR